MVFMLICFTLCSKKAIFYFCVISFESKFFETDAGHGIMCLSSTNKKKNTNKYRI